MKKIILLLFPLIVCQFSCAGLSDVSQPDILVIMPDQMRGDCLSILGHPAVKTPHLDELARNGILFRRAYTTVPSCIPARYALLTGLFPQTSGVVGYKARTLSTPTLPRQLAKAGYTTALVGRNMHQSDESGDLGYQTRLLGSTYIANDAYDQFIKKSVPEVQGIRQLVEDLGLTYNHWQAKPWPLSDYLHPTAWIVSESRKIVDQADKGKALFLTTSFYAPHPPLFPPKKYFDYYMQQDLPDPAKGNWVDWPTLSTEGDEPGHRILLQDEILKKAQAGYFGLIEHLDAQISSLIEDFKKRSEESGRAWIIVVTSDHGEMLGDHGFFRKCEPYEGSANIPFIISGSAGLKFKPGQRINLPVCLEDIMPTLLGLAGAEIPQRIDGIDLRPTLQGQKQVIRDWLHFEHATCYSREQAFHALTDGHYKYIWRPLDGSDQLFDLEKDGQEENDLSDKEAYQVQTMEWREKLIRRLSSRPEGFVKNGELNPGCLYEPLNNGNL